MGKRTWAIVGGLVAAGALLAASGVQREHALLSGPFAETVREREALAAARPGDPEADRALAQAYLDGGQPGLAVALLRDVALAMGDEGGVRTRHLYGRALIEDGRGLEALSIEQGVVGACAPLVEGRPAAVGCDATLLASALRRVDILRELAALGVSDVVAHPEAALIAYQNATREVRVAMQ
jgi:hypothetical protein